MNQPESDWIEWGGGERPGPVDTTIMIRLRDFSEHGPVSLCDSDWRRNHIIAYRIVK